MDSPIFMVRPAPRMLPPAVYTMRLYQYRNLPAGVVEFREMIEREFLKCRGKCKDLGLLNEHEKFFVAAMLKAEISHFLDPYQMAVVFQTEAVCIGVDADGEFVMVRAKDRAPIG